MGKTKNINMATETTSKKVDKYAAKKEEQALAAKKQTHPRHGKNIVSARNKVNKNIEYSLSEAVAILKETSFTKFDATIELHARVRKQGLSVSFVFPNTFGSEKKVVFATDETVKELENGKINFDVLLASTEMMPKLVRFAKLLGPRGLMPNPKNGTIVKDESAVKSFSTATKQIKTEKDTPNIHLAVAKVSMSEKEILQNIEAVIKAVNEKQFVKTFLSSSMGPSIRVKVV